MSIIPLLHTWIIKCIQIFYIFVIQLHLYIWIYKILKDEWHMAGNIHHGPAMHFPHEITRMHGKLLNSLTELILTCIFSLINIWLIMFCKNASAVSLFVQPRHSVIASHLDLEAGVRYHTRLLFTKRTDPLLERFAAGSGFIHFKIHSLYSVTSVLEYICYVLIIICWFRFHW